MYVPIKATFGVRSGMGHDITIISGPRFAEKGVPGGVAYTLSSGLPCEQLVTSGRSQEKREKVTVVMFPQCYMLCLYICVYFCSWYAPILSCNCYSI